MVVEGNPAAESESLNTPHFSDISNSPSPDGSDRVGFDQCDAVVAGVESEKRKPSPGASGSDEKRSKLRDDPLQGVNHINSVLKTLKCLVRKEGKEKVEALRVKDQALKDLVRVQVGIDKTVNDMKIYAVNADREKRELNEELKNLKEMCASLKAEKLALEDRLAACQGELQRVLTEMKKPDCEVQSPSFQRNTVSNENDALSFLKSRLIENGVNFPK